jgi:phospholipid-transporting ATPase
VRASDYAIAQFSFLQKLLLVYGLESYRRNSNLIGYNFYKNVLVVAPLFFYGSLSVFCGVILYNNWTYNFYNISFTSFPIMIYALFDL